MKGIFNRSIINLYDHAAGRGILSTLDELKRSQWLSQDELHAMQQAKLKRLLHYAYRFVPYYRKTFDQVSFHPDDFERSPESFYQLPILTKPIIREHWDEMQTTEPERRRQLSRLSTSGSTGQPLIFMQDPVFRNAVTADIQRNMEWCGLKLGELQAFIWGLPLKRSLKQAARTRLIDAVWNRFFLNAFAMTEPAMHAFARRIQSQKPAVLFGYATSIYRFAQFVEQHSYSGITFRGIYASAEQLMPSVRNYIESVFPCRVFNRYGTLELGGVACECEAHTGMHLSMENNWVEILDQGMPAADGVMGDLIVTNLNNLGMPFIRYSIGDVAAWQPETALRLRAAVSPVGHTGRQEGGVLPHARRQDCLVWLRWFSLQVSGAPLDRPVPGGTKITGSFRSSPGAEGRGSRLGLRRDLLCRPTHLRLECSGDLRPGG